MRARRTLLVLVAAVAASLPAASAAPAQDSAQLEFPDERPLSLSFEQAQAGRVRRVCNTGGKPARNLEAEATGFGFKDAGKPVDEATALVPPAGATSLDPGKCADLSIRLAPQQSLDDGSYAGVVAVRASGSRIARLQVTIAGKPPETTPAKPAGALDTAPLRGRRSRLVSDDFELDDGGRLPLRAPILGKESLALPPPGTFLGNLFHGADAAQVFVADGEVEKKDDVWYLPLRIEGADEAGDYTGKLDVAQNDKPAEGIPVKLAVTDKWWCAVLAILAGSLLSLLAQLCLLRWRPQIGLWWHRWRLQDRYDEAKRDFAGRTPPFEGFDRPSREAVEAYKDAVEANQKQYRRSVIFFDTTSDGYKTVEKALRQAEDDAKLFGKADGLHASLVALSEALVSLATFLQTDLRTRRHPRLVRTAGALLNGKQLKVGEATERAAKADDFVTFMDEWKAIAGRAKRYQIWAMQLAGVHFGESGTRMSDADFRILDRATVHVAEAKRELFAASDREALAAVDAVGNLDSAYDRLAYLGARYGPWEPDPEAQLGDTPDVDWDQFPAARSMKGMLMLASAEPQPFGTWLGELAELVVSPASAGAVIKTLRRLLDSLIVLTAVLVGLVAGLSTLYFGKNFGTAEDYLTAILVGAASQALTKGVLDALTQIRKQDAGLIEEEPKPAAVSAAP